MGRRKSLKKAGKQLRKKAKSNTGGNKSAAEQFVTGQVRDGNSSLIFQNPSLFAQFLRDNTGIPALKDVRPEDITDVTKKYRAYLGIHFEADTVKKVRLRGKEFGELFLISLIEHKSRVDYNVAIQLFRYMVCIWTEYAREMEAKQEGITRTKSFRYPPILPIVYYEGSESWTADLNFRDRIHLKDVFGEYLPDFTYKVVRIHDYTNEELLDREDEMSFLMMLNRVQTAEDMSAFLQVEREKVKKIVDRASPQILEIFAETIWSLCMKMNVSLEEAEECVKQVKERNMGYLFENMEKMDIQEERRKTTEACKHAEEAKNRAEEAKKHAEEVQKRAEEAESRAEEAESHAEEAENRAKQANELGVRKIIQLTRRFGAPKEAAVKELMDTYDMTGEEAQEKVALYWNEA